MILVSAVLYGEWTSASSSFFSGSGMRNVVISSNLESSRILQYWIPDRFWENISRSIPGVAAAGIMHWCCRNRAQILDLVQFSRQLKVLHIFCICQIEYNFASRIWSSASSFFFFETTKWLRQWTDQATQQPQKSTSSWSMERQDGLEDC